MKNFMTKIQMILIGLILILFSCEDPNYPNDIWDENDNGNSSPIVTGVLPADGAFAGIDTVIISGQNFSTNLEENLVYFNSMLGAVVNATTTELLVIPPNLVSDSVTIKVAAQGAFTFGEFDSHYRLTAAVQNYGPFDQFTDIYSLDLDLSENLYVSMDGSPNAEIWMVDANGDSSVWSGALAKGSGMKIGPTGSMYFVNFQRYLYKDEQGTPKENTEIFKRLSGNATDLDFDANGNLFVGGTGSVIDVVNIYDDSGLTSGVTEVKDLGDLDVINLRVFGEFVYILTTDPTTQKVIYRLPILDTAGNLGDLEVVYDWSANNTESTALCFTLTSTGDLFVGSDSESNPLVLIQNGIEIGFYSSVLVPPISYMAWGNNEFLYLINRIEETNRVLKVDTRMEGAEYYGRP
ncbi:MAG: IPT/TIG domain-containing protein [Candidatus Marinimicrobia bacterium]|jgi:hypothetical protein|nr:IPT/TIG domain-containing protein [Candidatus Neomarinimicrobiota bacterium]MBT3962242.1 IPT/TIG domain-containing protein [Candidatus Neomarinimicrobiota bacterium]